MPRGRSKYKRPKPQQDLVYKDLRVGKFINYLMLSGKKSVAQRVVYKALQEAAKQLQTEDILQMLDTAVENIRPQQEVRPRRVGGSTYQIPIPVPRPRGETMAFKWIIASSRSRKGVAMEKKLADELVNAYNGAGEAFKKKENMHKAAEANRAFAHFRW